MRQPHRSVQTLLCPMMALCGLREKSNRLYSFRHGRTGEKLATDILSAVVDLTCLQIRRSPSTLPSEPSVPLKFALPIVLLHLQCSTRVELNMQAGETGRDVTSRGSTDPTREEKRKKQPIQQQDPELPSDCALVCSQGIRSAAMIGAT